MPQKGIHSCEYCGYDLSKNTKLFKTIRNKLEDIIGEFGNDQMFANKKAKMKGHRGIRSGTNRRKYKHTHYYPERGSGIDRRSGVDR